MKKIFILSLIVCNYFIAQSQNVGIGTPSPAEKLDINGNVNIAGTIKANGVAGIGGQVLSSTGTGLQWIDMSKLQNFTQFNYTGAAQTWTVPAGVTRLMIEEWGGGGGAELYVSGSAGSYLRSVLSVVAGTVVSITIGSGGLSTDSSSLLAKALNGGNTVVSFNEFTLTAIGGNMHSSGGFSVVPATFHSYMGFNGGTGNLITRSSLFNRGAVSLYFGKGGDAPFVANTGGIGAFIESNDAGDIISNVTYPPVKATSPGGGAGYGYSFKTQGGDGMVIIYY